MTRAARGEVLMRAHELQSNYDVVIIGAGVHGLAAAYYLGKTHQIRRVALLDRGYVGSGNSTRNTCIVRSNYRTPQGIPFYNASLELYSRMGDELGWDVSFRQSGHFTLAHSESGIIGLRVRAENNRALGVESRVVYREELSRMVPQLDCSSRPQYPVLAALYHPPGGTVWHDDVITAYARACEEMKIEIHPFTEVTDISVASGRVQSVYTKRGVVSAGVVLNATAGWCSHISRMAGVPLPVVTYPLQACVTEILPPFLEPVLVSSDLHVYVWQTVKGELVIGSEIDAYQSYSRRCTLPTLELMAAHTLELLPQLHAVRILRQWAGTCDMTPDYAPIMGLAEEVQNFYMDVGWGTYGFKAAPISGKCMAEMIATGKAPDLIAPFTPSRFRTGELLGEKAAASVSQ